MFKPMYLCGWLIFDYNSVSFRKAFKVWLEPYNTREDAQVLASIYTRIFTS